MWELIENIRKARELVSQGKYLAAVKLIGKLALQLLETFPDEGEFQAMSIDERRDLEQAEAEVESFLAEVNGPGAAAIGPGGLLLLKLALDLLAELLKRRLGGGAATA